MARWAARAAASTSRALGLGEGGTIPGRVFTAVAGRSATRPLAARMKVVLVSGTNGKTTTTALIAAAVRQRARVATNSSGANLLSGIHTALLEEPSASVAVLEVDELVLPEAARTLDPDVIVLLNLSRDQLDRVHEVKRTARAWRSVLAATDAVVVANADDVLVAWAAEQAPNVAWVATASPVNVDGRSCPACAARVRVVRGAWACSGCGRARPDAPDVEPPVVGAPGRCNEMNAAMAYGALVQLGMEYGAHATWPDIASVSGRYECFAIDGREVRLLLAKNPAGWAELVDVVREGDRALAIALNAHTEDGADTSWIWDVPFERFGPVAVTCSGERALDLALRLQHAGMHVSVQRDLATVVSSAPGDLDLVANYSAFRSARRLLERAR